MSTQDEDLTGRMCIAYMTARRIVSSTPSIGRTVRMHVGQEAWDWMRALTNSDDPALPPNIPATAWGFPVVLKSGRSEDYIAVVTEQLIF